jgi:hypothetical protein
MPLLGEVDLPQSTGTQQIGHSDPGPVTPGRNTR